MIISKNLGIDFESLICEVPSWAKPRWPDKLYEVVIFYSSTCISLAIRLEPGGLTGIKYLLRPEGAIQLSKQLKAALAWAKLPSGLIKQRPLVFQDSASVKATFDRDMSPCLARPMVLSDNLAPRLYLEFKRNESHLRFPTFILPMSRDFAISLSEKLQQTTSRQ